MIDLTGKNIIVTGAGSGMGEAAAIKCAEAGAKVILIDKQAAEQTAEKIRNMDKEAVVFETDVSEAEHMKQTFEEISQSCNTIDAIFANAGMNGKVTSIEDLQPEDWDSTLAVNLRGTFLTVKYAIPFMKDKGGSIVITSSVNGTRIFSNIGMTAYSASKAGQLAFGKMAAIELAGYNIRVNVICPGAVNTNIGERTFEEKDELKKVELPLKTTMDTSKDTLLTRSGEPENVADLFLFLASDNSSHISGIEMFIDGSQSLM
ncbi:SDR family oxidoreductase [Alteribacillus sp. HJP-4]|uniref:SDR family oxidoreductase n=1 Tax=Alteribacillus sp. HJP-4 TaxID=2775394 RepID=UPI0035CD06B3